MDTIWIILIAAVALALLALLATRFMSGRRTLPGGGGTGQVAAASSVAVEERDDLDGVLETLDVNDSVVVDDTATTDDRATTDDIATIDELEEALADDKLVEEPLVKPSFFDRLGKARSALTGYLGGLVGLGKVDDEAWEDLEEALIRADVGVGVTMKLIAEVQDKAKEAGVDDGPGILALLKEEMRAEIANEDRSLTIDEGETNVWLFVGVNGVGKTTTIGKLGRRLADEGNTVLMAAGDTFRAAAAEQLTMWAERSGAEIVRGNEGGDPSSVIFDGIQAAKARGCNVVLADTAGRLQNKSNLMEELSKVRRVASKEPGHVSEVLLVIDATTGQNGMSQAKVFADAVDVTGVVLTKLDGSAKGGIVFAIESELGLPVKLVGLGEGVGDLVDFDPDAFIDALFE
ncbi:MAG: signal recognition particle-docking protein FtsY [Acidimicrobiales bacterium]